MNQNHIPLYEALIEFKERRPLSFHVPVIKWFKLPSGGSRGV